MSEAPEVVADAAADVVAATVEGAVEGAIERAEQAEEHAEHLADAALEMARANGEQARHDELRRELDECRTICSRLELELNSRPSREEMETLIQSLGSVHADALASLHSELMAAIETRLTPQPSAPHGEPTTAEPMQAAEPEPEPAPTSEPPARRRHRIL